MASAWRRPNVTSLWSWREALHGSPSTSWAGIIVQASMVIGVPQTGQRRDAGLTEQ